MKNEIQNNKYTEVLKYSIGIGALGWLVFIIADACDELLLHVACSSGRTMYCFIPMAIGVNYCMTSLKKKYDVKTCAIWLGSFWLTNLLICILIATMMALKVYPIVQVKREYEDYNGIEYLLYELTTGCGVVGLGLLFHFLRFIGKLKDKLHKKKENPDNESNTGKNRETPVRKNIQRARTHNKKRRKRNR